MEVGMLRLTPSHIIAVAVLVFTLFCCAGALIALVIAALHLFPNSAALALFRDCAGAGLATAGLAARHLRK
jgi:hypothetical protein